MKKYLVPVSYEVYGHITIEANTPEEAIELARNKDLPKDIEDKCYEYDFALGEDPNEVELDEDDSEEYIAFANEVAKVLGIHDWIALDERYGDMVKDLFEEGLSVAEAVQACRDDDYEYSDECVNERMKRLSEDSE